MFPPIEAVQVFGPVMPLEALPAYTREALSRALASWLDARRKAFSPSVPAAMRETLLDDVFALRGALEEALWSLGPIALPGSSPYAIRSYLPSVFNPGDSFLLRHAWAFEEAFASQALLETPWNP